MMHDRKPRDFMGMDGRYSEASNSKNEGEGEVEKKKKTVRLAHGAEELSPKMQGNWVRGRARPNYLTP